MHPDAWRDLLLNLKLQLLALPSLLRWGVLAFAGIMILREGITAAWNLHQRRQSAMPPEPGPSLPVGVHRSTGATTEPAGLPGPDPLAPDFHREPEVERAEPSTPAGGSSR